jgi:hypothetical protein
VQYLSNSGRHVKRCPGDGAGSSKALVLDQPQALLKTADTAAVSTGSTAAKE